MQGSGVSPAPACRRGEEDCPLFRIIHGSPSFAKFFQPLKGHFHWDHFTDFCLLVVTIAWRWGQRHVANLSRQLEAPAHRTRLHNFCLVARWDPEAALRQTAQAFLRPSRPAREKPAT